MNHLYIRALCQLAAEREGSSSQLHLCTAASIANEILMPVLEKGAINVSTAAMWLADIASKRYVIRMAVIMVEWAQTLKNIDVQLKNADLKTVDVKNLRIKNVKINGKSFVLKP